MSRYDQYNRKAPVTIDGKSVAANKVYGPGTPWGLLFALLCGAVVAYVLCGGTSN